MGIASFIQRSLFYRRSRSLSALVALTVSAAIATALLTLYGDLDSKLHHEFRSFGANVVITNFTPDPDVLARARSAAGSDALLALFGYAVATTDRGTPVVVGGVDFDAVRKLDSWWQVDAWPGAPDAALIGTRAAEFIGNEKAVTLAYAGTKRTFAGAGRLRTGAEEDSRIYVPLPSFTVWTGVRASVLEIQVPGGAQKVEDALARLHAALPGAKVDAVRQLVEGESQIVDRTHALMFAAVVLIALTVAISVLSTLSASVLERRRDFALMKALGGTEAQMLSLFLVETLLLASAGVAVGWLLGSGAAWVISETNFHTASLPRVQVIPAIIALNGLIAALAAFFPIRSLRNLQPAALLKGE